MAKWGKTLLAVVVGIGIFFGVTAFVYDLHFLGGDPGPQLRLDACVEQAEFVDMPTDPCYQAYGRDLDRRYEKEMQIAVASGAAAAALFGLLAYMLFLRRRGSTAQPA